MKAQSYAIPNALAVTTAIVFVLCRMLVSLFPNVYLPNSCFFLIPCQ